MDRQIYRTKPIVLARMGEFVSQEPRTAIYKERRFDNDNVPYGNSPQTLEASGG